jgi:hypothetical protein
MTVRGEAHMCTFMSGVGQASCRYPCRCTVNSQQLVLSGGLSFQPRDSCSGQFC